jgi:hypothetical protein
MKRQVTIPVQFGINHFNNIIGEMYTFKIKLGILARTVGLLINLY